MNIEEIKQMILAEEDALIKIRRDLHMYPELSFEEHETTQTIAGYLKEWGIPYRYTEPTGIIAEIDGGHDGKTILLRADMDALPIQEENDVEYRSRHDGVMHACGHDTHVAMLLVASKLLNRMKEQMKGKVRLVFQPAEEIGQGAKAMVEQGVLDGVDRVFGLHINSAWDLGTVYCQSGEMMAANDSVKITFIGKEGHGARPNEGVDAMMMGASFLMNVQHVVGKVVSPLETAVITFGKMQAGAAANVVAGQAILEGAVRSFNSEVSALIEKSITRFAKATADMYGGQVRVEYERKVPAVINDSASAELFYEIAGELLGSDQIDREGKKTGSEDFSFYMSGDQGVPGVFAFVGARSDCLNTQYNHHTSRFDIDERALKIGVYFHVIYALSFLRGGQSL